METTITLSTERILEEIYALSALRTYTSGASQPPALLTPDNRQALLPVAGDAIATTALHLIGVISDIDFGAERPQDVELVRMTLKGNAAECGAAVRRAIEEAVTYRVLGSIYMDDDPRQAEIYEERFRQSVEAARHLATMPGDDLPDIVPCYL